MSFCVTFEAGPLEDGQTCPCCQEPIHAGQVVGRCPACNHVQHEACWQAAGQCCSYECAGEPAMAPPQAGPDLVITQDEVAEARPPAPPTPGASVRRLVDVPAGPVPERRLSRLAVAALVCGILGIVAFGAPGLAGIALGAIAIGTINVRRHLKGLRLAVAGIALGVVGILGWAAVASHLWLEGDFFGGGGSSVFKLPVPKDLSPADLENTPEPIRRAIRANVLITSRSALRMSEGSGVVLEKRGDEAFVITNRHVIDGADGGLTGSPSLQITFSDGTRVPATIVCRGASGVDVAVLRCDHDGGLLDAAPVRAVRLPSIGASVFAIGNPVGLGWSYANGVISAIRKQGSLRMIQTQTPLNPGNSGGGLYDESGALVGINTMTVEKRRAEGIGFAIAIADLVTFLETKAKIRLRKAAASGNPKP